MDLASACETNELKAKFVDGVECEEFIEVSDTNYFTSILNKW